MVHHQSQAAGLHRDCESHVHKRREKITASDHSVR